MLQLSPMLFSSFTCKIGILWMIRRRAHSKVEWATSSKGRCKGNHRVVEEKSFNRKADGKDLKEPGSPREEASESKSLWMLNFFLLPLPPPQTLPTLCPASKEGRKDRGKSWGEEI